MQYHLDCRESFARVPLYSYETKAQEKILANLWRLLISQTEVAYPVKCWIKAGCEWLDQIISLTKNSIMCSVNAVSWTRSNGDSEHRPTRESKDKKLKQDLWRGVTWTVATNKLTQDERITARERHSRNSYVAQVRMLTSGQESCSQLAVASYIQTNHYAAHHRHM